MTAPALYNFVGVILAPVDGAFHSIGERPAQLSLAHVAAIVPATREVLMSSGVVYTLTRASMDGLCAWMQGEAAK